MASVAITCKDGTIAAKCVEAVSGFVEIRLITSKDVQRLPEDLLAGIGGLLLGSSPDVDPASYGEPLELDADLKLCPELDHLELGLLRWALDKDMPVLAVGRGLQLLNVAFGGKLIQDVPGHHCELKDAKWVPARHSIYLSPGSKVAAILGTGGFFQVNSLHRQGLREAQKAPELLASAYSLDDGIIEGLESPEHSWVIAVQFRPERQDEVPRAFRNLFTAFCERAEGYGRKPLESERAG